ncbi:Tyrosyl-DNA phosphodiesterase 2 [Galemys pyrenaicus]|uniref:Tyrosyl-DNA phosphodiesterase 2 n=1 Tax=Galemys pyrenaicus TaxID=202257 RepID=A0A8J6AJ39_GALPY|nr:Tyrosyl-DNA phosphodiesterase 2 [Galemys pyrenaicus]
MEPGSGVEAGVEAEREDGEPEVKRRKLLCVEFASVASCDAAVAQCFLAENDWEMERALNSYFESPVEESTLKSLSETSPERQPCVDLTSEETADSSGSKTSSSENAQQEDGSMLSVINWNIDGLDLKNLQERARGVCSYLTLYSPDVVFLQEVIPPYYSYLKKRANNYDIFAGNNFPVVYVFFFEEQVSKCGGLPSNILDVWEFLGKPKHCQYTWDTQMNSNLGISASRKHRFDRIFFRAAAAESGNIIPRSLDLLGLEKLDCGRFPSDHWGLLCNLDVIL